MTPIKYFSMFSGIGGFEYGMEQSNIDFQCVGFCEVDKYAESIYSRHFPECRNYGDATEIRTEELSDFDFLVGGFPCQAFSNAGLRRGFDDTRGTLFFEIARILKDKRPTYFLLENVRGLLSHNKGETFATILEILSDLGYFIKWEVFNSKDFSVPQRRERVFIEGYSRKECGREVLSLGNCYETNNVKSITGDDFDDARTNQKVKIIGNVSSSNHWRGDVMASDGISKPLTACDYKDALKVIETDDILEKEKDNRKIISRGYTTPSNHGHSLVHDTNGISRCLSSTDYKHPINILEENVGEIKREEIVEEVIGSTQKHSARTDGTYSPTLTEAMGKGGGHVPMLKIRETTKKGYKEAYPNDGVLLNRGNRKIAKGIVRDQHCGCLQTSGVWGTVTSDFRIRKLTPLECERLQGFPDDWTKWGKDNELISDTQRYKCIGNAVTTTVITAIVNEMFDGIYEEDTDES